MFRKALSAALFLAALAGVLSVSDSAGAAHRHAGGGGTAENPGQAPSPGSKLHAQLRSDLSPAKPGERWRRGLLLPRGHALTTSGQRSTAETAGTRTIPA